MRLHELSITAFGPFAETVHVDFDELAAAGVFLLTGDTGSGKTSVLDAVCFALYGEVPGDRHSARHLRSDQADPHAQPRVRLRVGIGERLFRFSRSPAWDRPKRRGTGTTRVQASVVVEEQRDGEWIALTNRLDEAGHLVAGLLGMTCTQFTQVAMLPQGRFQTFLRASSAERQAVLQRLFRTRRFEDVERWLVERRQTLWRDHQLCHDRVVGVVNRLQEAAGVGVPDGWDLHDLDAVLTRGCLRGWAAELARAAGETAQANLDDLTATTVALEDARTACEHGRQLADARSRGQRARQSLADLARTSELEEALVRSVDGHRRAMSVLPTALRAETAQTAADEAESAAVVHRTRVARLLPCSADDVGPQTLAAAVTQANEARAVAESWLPREVELHDERARLTSLTARLAVIEARIAETRDERVVLATSRERTHPALTRAQTVAAQGEPLRRAVEAAAAGLDAAAAAVTLSARLDEAKDLLRETTRHAQDLREHHLDLRERRISGMAAELASGLAAGCSCPVCGSAEHPSPATASGRVSRADEEAAREHHETADFERQAVRESVTGLTTQLDGARARSQGLGVREWQQRRVGAELALQQSLEAASSLPALESELAALEARDVELARTLVASQASLESSTQQHVECERRCAALTAELHALLAAHPGTSSVAALVTQHAERAQDLEEAHQALVTQERAAHELVAARAGAESAAAAAGFGSLDEAMAAVLPGSEAADRASVLDTRRATRTAATSVLQEDAMAAALAAPAPDLVGLLHASRTAESARDRAHAAHEQAAVRSTRLEILVTELEKEVATWEPVRTEHDLVAGLASLVEGRSADNVLKMRLSAYVLSERLRQVVAAANERLGEMTDQRYALEQADEKGAGEQRGGLSLRVRDEWTGKQRDPVTLSGGETFLVSLALALGLADTVSHEAGGTQLDTLFIDEGFGALDATTLDAVMDTLDSLRDGGRVIGVVSHVVELRHRIPSQLEVRKARQGSTLSVCVTPS